MREEEQLDLVAGRVDHIVYRNEDGSFAVLELDDGRDLVTVVGSFGDVYEGEELEVRGRFVTHPTFGTQLKAVYFERSLPATAGAMKSYLGSGVIKGIGPKTAERIVAHFGTQTLEVILKTPEQLTAVRGISADKARMLGDEVKRMFGLRELIAFLEPYGIKAQTAVAAFSRYGAETLELIDYSPEIETYLKIICFPTTPGHCGCLLFDIAELKIAEDSGDTGNAKLRYFAKMLESVM